jgi:hypothetical protein
MLFSGQYDEIVYYVNIVRGIGVYRTSVIVQRPFLYKQTITTRPGLFDSLRLRFCFQNQPTIITAIRFLSRTVNSPVKNFPDSSGKQLFSGLNTQTGS